MQYNNELLHHYIPCHSLYSIDSNLLVIPETTAVTYDDRSFVVISPKIWNQLSLAIRQRMSVDSFKRALKRKALFLFSDFHFVFTVQCKWNNVYV